MTEESGCWMVASPAVSPEPCTIVHSPAPGWPGFTAPSPSLGVITLFYLSRSDLCAVIPHCIFPVLRTLNIFSWVYLPSVEPLQ